MPRRVPALALSLVVACGAPAPRDVGSAPAGAQGPTSAPVAAAGSTNATPKMAATTPAGAGANTPPASAPAANTDVVAAAPGERAAILADLELLCAALRRDYVDGTLTDYYAGLAPTTALGQDLRRRGEETVHPGRLLQAAARDLAISPSDPAIPACNALFDDLDDLE